MAEDRRVAFIVCGVQKGGTTALFEYLTREPGVAMSRVKEVHFFDDETRDWSAPDYGDYHAQFDSAATGLWGEATPIYSYWPNSLERIAAYNPAVRLILILRDPVQRAWSHWRMEYARGAERRPFDWCVRRGRQRLFEATPWGHHREFSYVERGFYAEQAQRLFGLFPREQILILKSEDLRADPAGPIGQVRDLLGLPAGPQPAALEAHVGRDGGYPSDLTAQDVAHLRAIYARDDERLLDLTGVSYAASV